MPLLDKLQIVMGMDVSDVESGTDRVKREMSAMSDHVDRTSSKVGGLGKSLGKAGFVAAAAAATAAMAGFAAVAVTGWKEMSEASAGAAQLAAGIESTGNKAGVTMKGMLDLASAVQKYSGQTDDSIVQTQSLLLTFTNVRNVGIDKIFDRATMAAADMSAKMGGDAAANAIKLGKALNDPVKGIGALSRVGVVFTQDQKDMVAEMVAAGDVMGAQKVILDELQVEFGGAAKAAGQSFPGQLSILKRSFEDLSQTAMEKLIPVILPFMQKLTTLMADLTPVAERVFGAIGDGLSGFGETLTGIFDKIDFGAVWDTMKSVFEPLVGMVKTIGDQVKDSGLGFKDLGAIFSALNPIMGIFKEIWPKLLPLITTVTGIIIKLAAQVLPMLVKLWDQVIAVIAPLIARILPVLIRVVLLVADGFGKLITQIAPMIDRILPTLVSLFESVMRVAEPILMALLGMFENVFPTIMSLVEVAMGAIMKVVEFVLPIVQELFDTVLGDILDVVMDVMPYIQQIIEGVMKAIQGVIELVMAIIKGDWDKAWTALKDIFQGVWDAIKGIFDAAWKLLQGALELGLDIIKGLWEAAWGVISAVFRETWEAITGVLSGIWEDSIKPFFVSIPGKAKDALLGLGGALKDAFIAAWNGIKEGLDWLWTAMETFFKGIPGWIVTALGDLGDILFEFFKGIWGRIWDALTWLGSKISDFFKSIFGSSAAPGRDGNMGKGSAGGAEAGVVGSGSQFEAAKKTAQIMDTEYVKRSGDITFAGGMSGLVKTTQLVWNRIKNAFPGSVPMGGYATSGHVVGSDHYTGHAFDVGGSWQVMTAIRNLLESHWKDWGIKQVIFNRMSNRGFGRYPYTGTSPHLDHVHVSTYGKGGLVEPQESTGAEVPIIAHAGEYVLTKNQADALFKGAQRFARGGGVRGSQGYRPPVYTPVDPSVANLPSPYWPVGTLNAGATMYWNGFTWIPNTPDLYMPPVEPVTAPPVSGYDYGVNRTLKEDEIALLDRYLPNWRLGKGQNAESILAEAQRNKNRDRTLEENWNPYGGNPLPRGYGPGHYDPLGNWVSDMTQEERNAVTYDEYMAWMALNDDIRAGRTRNLGGSMYDPDKSYEAWAEYQGIPVGGGGPGGAPSAIANPYDYWQTAGETTYKPPTASAAGGQAVGGTPGQAQSLPSRPGHSGVTLAQVVEGLALVKEQLKDLSTRPLVINVRGEDGVHIARQVKAALAGAGR